MSFISSKIMSFSKEFTFFVLLLSLESKQVLAQPKVCEHGFSPITIAAKDAADKPGLCDKALVNVVTGGNSVVKSDTTNGIQSFCVAIDFVSPPSFQPIPLGDGRAAQECYNPIPPPENASHAAGNDPNWALLHHLVTHKAQSYQPFDDLPYVDKFAFEGFKDIGNGGPFMKLSGGPIKYNPLPVERAPNPYFVEVTGISMKGELLQNFLHFRIFANLSVALGKDQEGKWTKVLHGRGADEYPEDKSKGQKLAEKPNYATGKISALLIMVKDQDGWPIGDFSTPIPCDRTCSKYSHDVFYGDESNAVPCSYTPPYASTHPGMFLFDVDPGRYCTKPGDEPETPKVNFNKHDPRLNIQTARLEGVREVHATWSFHHDSCNFAEKLYIQTLVFEDVETVYKANISEFGLVNASVLFGWTAQYNILKPTKGSYGSPDYVNLRYFKERDKRHEDVDCHVPLFDAPKTVPFTFEKYLVPSADVQDENLLTLKIPSRTPYNAVLQQKFKANRALRYFGWAGDNLTTQACRPFPGNQPEVLSAFLKNGDADHKGIRCPCPALASEEPIENRTADPARLHGRLIHASHMAIAYMFLTPIGCFVVRYYKETFVTVFCFQEYWWYMWHVVTLIVACMFNVGAITSTARKKQSEIKFNQNLVIHVILGAISIFVFYMEIFTGFFRVADPKKRMRQIFTHWLIGTLNNLCAVMSMFAMAWVDQSGFTCNTAITTLVWLIFVITCYAIMEYNMRQTDKKLKLIPRRSYLPPPVKRLFTKEPPGRSFRVGMLIIFILGLIAIQAAMSYFIWDEEGASCHEEFRASNLESKRKQLAAISGVEEEGGIEEGGEDY